MEHQCQAIKLNYEVCTNRSHEDGYCRVHLNAYRTRIQRAGPVPTTTCRIYDRNRWCARECTEGFQICDHHRALRHAQRTRRHRRHQRNELVRTTLNQLYEDPDRIEWRHLIRNLVERRSDVLNLETIERIGRPYFMWREPQMYDRLGTRNALRYFFDYCIWEWNRQVYNQNGRPMPREEDYPVVPILDAPPIPGTTELARISHDSQNVHTTPVVQQTNENLNKLLAMSNPTPVDIYKVGIAWIVKGLGTWNEIGQVLTDIGNWYEKATCKTHNDYLYQKALDGLYTYIDRATENKDELWKRMYEECKESVSMCCEGHLSRLANVMVGFDENFVAQRPVSEVLQEKMAAIASLGVPLEMKLIHARAVLAELNIPQDQHSSWLDAFEDDLPEIPENWENEIIA